MTYLILYSYLPFIAIPFVGYLVCRNRQIKQVSQEATILASVLMVFILQHELMWFDIADCGAIQCMEVTSPKANIPLLLIIMYGAIAAQIYLNYGWNKKRSS